MSPKDVKALRKLVQRQLVLRSVAIHGNYGENHEHKTVLDLMCDTNHVEQQIQLLLTPRFVLELLDCYEARNA
jgi:hypothetical protein